MSKDEYIAMRNNGTDGSYSPKKNGKINENGTFEETGRFIPVEPGLDSLNKNPDEVAFIENTDNTPRDKYRVVFFIMLIHGIGILMPWNMLINAKDYFEKYKLNVVDENNQPDPDVTYYRQKFLFFLGIFSQVPNFVMSGVNTFCQCGGQASPVRIVISIGIMVGVFVVTVILAMVDSTAWPVEFFWITMLTAVVLNMATGVYQNSTFGLAAILPMKYTNAIVLGNNLSGVFVASVNIICLALSPDARTQAIYYFVAAIVVLLIAFDAYFLLPLMKFYRHFKHIVEMSQNQAESPKRSLREVCSKFCEVFKKIWVQAVGVWFVFFVTLTIFPAIWSNVGRKDIAIPEKYWSAITCFLSFNLFAFIGNIVSAFVQKPGPKYVWIPIALRALFIPFFILCRFKLDTRTVPVVIDNDIAYIIGGIVLAFTSGYFSSLTMMYGPKLVEPEVAGIAGMIMAFCLVLGITTGVNFSLAVDAMVTSVQVANGTMS